MINDLPTLTWHFFEKPNKLTITDATFTTIIVAEYECDNDFVLDAKSFDMLKKLGGPIKVNDTTITFNKYKCQNQDIKKPELNLDDIIYSNTYNSDDLREATKYVGKQESFQGVLFNDNGDIFATDSFKFYFKRNISPYTRFFSVPVQFIRVLPKNDLKLNFTNTMVMCECELYKIYSRLYTCKVPAIEKICDNFVSKNYVEINNREELTYLPCDIIKIVVNNGVHFIFDDNEKQFTVDYDITTDFTHECYIAYEIFSEDKIKIDFTEKMIKINDKLIICCVNIK